MLFLYGPMLTIFVLSFQGPEGGLTFPMRGGSLHWFRQLGEGLGVIDIGAAFRRSLALGTVVMGLTVALSLLAALAYRKRLRGGTLLFYVVDCQPDHAVDHRLARHRPEVPPARHRPEDAAGGPRARTGSRPSRPPWACSARRSARS